MVTLRLKVNSSWLDLDLNQDQELELTYRTMDAEGLETLCSNYTTSFAVPRTANNISVLSPLFKIQTIYSAVTFDLYGKAKAALGINGRETFGYLSIDSIDDSFNVYFRSGMSLAIEELENRMVADIIPNTDVLNFNLSDYDTYYAYWDKNGTRNTDTYWDGSLKRWTNRVENYYYFFAPTSNDATISQIGFKFDSNKSLTVKYKTFDDSGTIVENAGQLTPLQLCLERTSNLRCAVKVSYVAQLILESLGYTIVYDTDFFDVKNKYHANTFMTLSRMVGTEESPLPDKKAKRWMPEISQKDFLVSFLKLFGLYLYYDGISLHVQLRRNYYDVNNVTPIDTMIEPDSIVIRPNPDYGKVKGQLECACKAMGDMFAAAQDTTPTANGTPSKDAKNILDGSCFKVAPMLYYVGPMSFPMWRNTNKPQWLMNAQCEREKLILIDSEDGGELITPGTNGYDGRFTLFETDILQPDDTLRFYEPTSGYVECAGFWKQYDRMLIADSWNNAVSMCPANDSILFNYQTKQTAPVNDLKNGGTYHQGFFNDVYQSYVTEITAKDNIEIECNGYITPEYMEMIQTCNLIVTLDNVACRIKEIVINLKGRCKLILQKILNPSNLVAGQNEFGPYFKTPQPLIVNASTTGSVATGIQSNMTLITGAAYGSIGLQMVTNNGRSVTASSVILPQWTASGVSVPMSLKGSVTYSSPELTSPVIQLAARVRNDGVGVIYQGEDSSGFHVELPEAGKIKTIKPIYYSMPEDAEMWFLNSSGGRVYPGSEGINIKANNAGEIEIYNYRHSTYPSLTYYLCFQTADDTTSYFAVPITLYK